MKVAILGEPPLAGSQSDPYARGLQTILFFGDSITCGVGASHLRNGYAQQIASELRGRARCVNPSEGGRTSTDGLHAHRAAALTYRPDLVVICFGANDWKPVPRRLRSGRLHSSPVAVPVRTYHWNLVEMVEGFRLRSGARSLIVTAPPIGCPSDIYRLCAVRAADDGEADVCDPVGEWNDSMLAADGAHPNDLGHALYARRVGEALTTLLTADGAVAHHVHPY